MGTPTDNDGRKRILICKDKEISYDDQNCYINGRILQQSESTESASESEGMSQKNTDPEDIALDEQKKYYSYFYKKHYTNMVFLAAAGTSVDNGISGTEGKTREGLWDACKEDIDHVAGKCKLTGNSAYTSHNIEEFLSLLFLYKQLNDKDDDFEKRLKNIEKSIVEKCTLPLGKGAPHKDFLSKITARKSSDPRIQLYTTNYDTLFEQAASSAGFTVVDGFSYTQPRVFSGRYFDYDFVNREATRMKNEENFISRVFHLYKLHGSLNWENEKKYIKEDDGKESGKETERIIQAENVLNPLIIYPATKKYESSYEQPYFEMMARFQQVLRKNNVLLTVIGFGFHDKHIQNVILEAVDQNPGFQLAIIDYTPSKEEIDKDKLRQFFVKGKIKSNVTIFFDTFRSFTEKYPNNETYHEDNILAGKNDESI